MSGDARGIGSSHDDGDVDLNLLVALDALLAEGSVAGAARRLGLSSSAMSRALARLRSATGDPLLVRAGRGMAPTPRAAELRDRVHALTRDVQAVLRPAADDLDIAALDLTFTIRANEGFMELFAAPPDLGDHRSRAARPGALRAQARQGCARRSGKG